MISITIVCIFAIVCFTATIAVAHPVSLSSALVDVRERQVHVEMQIMLEDLVLYHGLTGDGDLNYSAIDLRSAAENHQQFVLKYFSILDGHGKRLEGVIEQLAIEQIDGPWIPQRELMQRTIGLEILYELDQVKPDFLTFVQNFGGDQSSLPAIMDLHIVRDEHFQESAQLVTQRPHTVRIDWSLGGNGRRETLAELRQRRKEQFEERLGISSYSGLYSFLYITPFAIRHEILIPILSLEQWLPLQRKDPDFLEVDEQQAVKEAIVQFFEDHSSVSVNGSPINGTVQRMNFFGLDISDFALNAEARRVNVYQARVGVIINFPCPEVPQTASVSWNAFTETTPFVDSVVLVGNQKPDRFTFHAQSTEFHWMGVFSTPQAQPVKATQPLVSDERSSEVVAELLENIYRAFELRDDGQVYDLLASSIRGNLLRQVYLRIKRSLLMAEHGGELSHAQSVQVTSVKPLATNKNQFEVIWQVKSTTEHWGHIHNRLSEYLARLTLVTDGEFWKIDEFQLLDEKRLAFETKIRGYDSH